jgi:hypothetical protein
MNSTMFNPNRHFRKEYDKIFRHNPLAANTLLLLAELSDDRGQVQLGVFPEAELQSLLMARFDDCRAYQLPGEPKK